MDKKKKQQKAARKAGITQAQPVSYAWMPVLCIIIAFIVYTPVFKAGFVNWDDDDYVLKNFSITSMDNIKEIITEPLQGNYHPLTMLSLAFNYMISGNSPASYHVVNLLIHLVNILLVFFFIRRLTGGKPWIAFVVAMFFAIHPLHVESVAWVSERKDVLYTLFFLSAMLAYLRYLEKRTLPGYLWVLLLFICSLLSKPAAVVLPVVLLGIDYYKGRLKERWTWLDKIPLFVLSLAMGYLTLHAQSAQGATGGAGLFPVSFRFFFGFYGIMMYIVKTVFPFGLCTFYPFPPVNKALPVEYYISPTVGIALALLFIIFYKKERIIPFAILFYIANIVLVLQFLPVGSAIIADRYTYVALIGVFLVPAFYFQKWVDANNGKPPVMGIALLTVVTLILSVLSFMQAKTWQNSAALWDNAISIAPSSRAYTNRGLIFKREENFDKAFEMYNKAIEINKVETDALVNRGNIYFARQQYEKAIADYNACLEIDSNQKLAVENRGAAYASLGKYELALPDMNRSLELNPKSENGYANRAYLYQMLGRDKEAIDDYNKQMEVNHKVSADLLNGIALSYLAQKDYSKALETLNQAISMESKGAYYQNRAIVYYQLGKKTEARKDAAKAQSLGSKIDESFLKAIQ